MDMPDLGSLPMREVISFGLAHLHDEDDDADPADETPYQAALAELQRRDDESTFDAMTELCFSSDPDRRYLGLGVLGRLGYQRGRPWLEASLPLVLELAATDPDLDVVGAALVALGHLGDRRGLEIVLQQSSHPDAGIRQDATFALSEVAGDPPDQRAVQALLRLMADPDGEVRDWATCIIGATFEDLDSPAIRDALAARIVDDAGDTAGEAVLGLAIRKDQRAFEPIATWLHWDDVGNLVVEAAGRLSDPRFLPDLLHLKASGWQDDDPRPWVLDDAITACSQSGHAGTDGL